MVRYAGQYGIEVPMGRISNLMAEGFSIDLAARHTDRLLERSKRPRVSPVKPADREDIVQSRLGDSEAYRRIIERYQDHVAKIVWRFSRDRLIHEELIQDVFVEAYLSLASFRGRAPLSHWLSRIATRIGYHYWKTQARDRRLSRVSLQDWDMATQETMEAISANDAADLLHRLLAQLPPRDRLVLTLRYIEECDVAETAQRTGWSKTMVKVQTLRAKKKLEKLYFEREEEIKP
jgi:RNA polymerase sigma-70 factor (ECF subfamily)